MLKPWVVRAGFRILHWKRDINAVFDRLIGSCCQRWCHGSKTENFQSREHHLDSCRSIFKSEFVLIFLTFQDCLCCECLCRRFVLLYSSSVFKTSSCNYECRMSYCRRRKRRRWFSLGFAGTVVTVWKFEVIIYDYFFFFTKPKHSHFVQNENNNIMVIFLNIAVRTTRNNH